MKPKIDLPEDVRRRLRERLQAFCREHIEIDLGELRSRVLLDGVIEIVGTTVYNQALADAQAWMQSKLIDLDIDLGRD